MHRLMQTIRALGIGYFIGLMLIPPMALVGCGGPSRETTDARDASRTEAAGAQATVEVGVKRTVAQATSNLDAIGGALQRTDREPEGQAVRLQSRVIDNAMGISAAEKPLAKVSQAEWESINGDLIRATGALNALQDEAAQMRASLAAARSDFELKKKEAEAWQQKYDEESKSFQNTKFGAFLFGAGGVALTIARMAGVPGVAFLTDPLIKAIASPILKPLEAKAAAFTQQAAVASTAIVASDVGVSALDKLSKYLQVKSPALAEELKKVIHASTQGKADNIVDVFKLVAKGVATDASQQGQVAALLRQVRDDQVETVMGSPKLLEDMKLFAT